MAKVKIEGNASGTGTFTIAAPNSNTDRSITLPDAAGELLLANGDGSNLTGITTGKVLQVVAGYGTSQVDTTDSSNWTSTTVTASITPSSTSSKVLCLVVLGIEVAESGDGNIGIRYRLTRGGTSIYQPAASYGLMIRENTTVYKQLDIPAAFNYLDSPSTTSSTAYLVEFQAEQSGVQVSANTAYVKSSIILMEIAA